MFTEYKDWLKVEEHDELLAEVIYKDKWRFGQTSDDTIQPNYPCWFQNYWSVHKHDYVDTCPPQAKTLSERFMDMMPDDYILVRSMASSNTFAIDGDWHTDWPHPGVSITGVLYTDRQWERNWGGETLFVDEDGNMSASEYEPRKLITFDSSILHIGKGPQRRCKEMRSILAFQAVHTDALKERLNKNIDSSK